MEFKDRLKEKRMATHLSQSELAARAGVGIRTIQNYESGARTRISMDIALKLAKALEVPVSDLLDDAEIHVANAYDKGGAKDADYVQHLVSELSALFAGGGMDPDEKTAVMSALNKAYWDSTEENKKKYTPKSVKKKS